MKVLIAYDGSTCSEAAIVDLRRAGMPEACDALVVTVGELWLPSLSGYRPDDGQIAASSSGVVREAAERAEQARAKVLELFAAWTVRSEVRTGSPGRQILHAVRDYGPDLVVVGSHGRTGFSLVFFGSVSQKIATEADCSVRIARGRVSEPGAPVSLVIGVDGSAGGDAAVWSVAGRRWPEGSSALLVTAIGPLSLDARALEAELERVSEQHAPAAERLRRAGLDVSSAIRSADPRHLLVEEAAQRGADCVFLGAVGELTFERFVFGTVAAAVAARATCSVEIVRSQS